MFYGQSYLYLSYPPDMKTFLYYSISRAKPRISRELCLRVTSSNDLAFFESGSDLLQVNGRPRVRPLFSLLKYYFPWYEKLKEGVFHFRRLGLSFVDFALEISQLLPESLSLYIK